ncbi:hypothetical protein BCR42DRAFT_445227 [Absidia repens]|uniref:SEC7 domain-containing protein n=1 Tax=Absidia repens TaxID=90262 RepID=A0A1X2J0W0_9FUNG|nr:hypothetical protein BCR42DRAFT_445227 [Absidia repens]
MNDLKKPGSGPENRHSRRPMWRSLKVVTNAVIPVETSNLEKTTTNPPTSSANIVQSRVPDEDFITATTNAAATPKPASIKTIDYKKSRLSSWLSQQFYEHEEQTHYSPSWIDDREPATISNLSLVSHASSVTGHDPINGRKRSASVPDSPSTAIPYFLLQPVDHPLPTNKSTPTPPLSPPPVATGLPPPQQQSVPKASTKMIYPSSSTSSTLSDHSPLTTPAIMDDHSFAHSFGTLQLPIATTSHIQEESNNRIDHENDDDDDDDDDDDETYTTASGSNSYSGDMDNKLDESNVFHINQNGNNDNVDEINVRSTNNDDHNSIAPLGNRDIDDNDDDDEDGGNGQYCSPRLKHRTSSMQALHVNSVMDAMDPDVAQALLEWRRQSLLNVDWFDLFSVKSELWRSSTLFHQSSPLQQLDHMTSSHSSIATSLISLDYKGVPLDKAFRSYSDKIDYAKASVLDIDQALKVFAQLYWECNPNPLFRCAELVYIVVHSLMLLLTDVPASQERITADDFCVHTIDLIVSHQASIPMLLFDVDGESTWHQSMVEYLQSLYKSFSRSSLFPLDQPHLPNVILYYQHHNQRKQEDQSNQEPRFNDQLETAFDNLFINPIESQDNQPVETPKQSTLAPAQKKQKQIRRQRRRSKSLNSTPSWTSVRRRDTYRTKIGPYKEGPLSCQLNGEEWKVCWVILHHGHLYVYHHKDGRAAHPILHNPLTMASPSSVSLETSSRTKIKQKFMHHITSSNTANATNISPAASQGQLKKKEPYQVVDLYLGNAFCEKKHPYAFQLQLVNGNSYIFDCGSESHAALWIQDCNYWAARETKVVLSRGLLVSSSSPIVNDSPLSSWKRPPPPAGASVLDKKGQQEAIDTHLLCLQSELKTLLQQESGSTTHPAWHDKKTYLELEIRKYRCYHHSIN